MKGGFEDLKALDENKVYEETRVSQTVFSSIINKNFKDLKPVQAKGLIKVLEKAYNLDLSPWLSEYETFLAGITPKAPALEKLAAQSHSENKKSFPKSWIIAPIVILLVLLFFYSFKDNAINEIQETNLSTEANETNITALLNVPIEVNSTNQAEPIIVDSNISTITNGTPIAFEVIPRHKLWLGIYYIDDDNKSDFRDDVNETTKLNPARSQILVMGPAFVSVKLGDSLIDSNNDGVVRYLYDAKERKIKYITKQEFETLRPPKKPLMQDKNQTQTKVQN
jgi:hypothetical protein